MWWGTARGRRHKAGNWDSSREPSAHLTPLAGPCRPTHSARSPQPSRHAWPYDEVRTLSMVDGEEALALHPLSPDRDHRLHAACLSGHVDHPIIRECEVLPDGRWAPVLPAGEQLFSIPQDIQQCQRSDCPCQHTEGLDRLRRTCSSQQGSIWFGSREEVVRALASIHSTQHTPPYAAPPPAAARRHPRCPYPTSATAVGRLWRMPRASPAAPRSPWSSSTTRTRCGKRSQRTEEGAMCTCYRAASLSPSRCAVRWWPASSASWWSTAWPVRGMRCGRTTCLATGSSPPRPPHPERAPSCGQPLCSMSHGLRAGGGGAGGGEGGG